MPPDVHLINPLEDHIGGSEQRTITLYHLLRSVHASRVCVWSTAQPHASIAAAVPVTVLNAVAGLFPKDGVLVFVGVYYEFGDWLQRASPERIVLIVNLYDPSALAYAEHQLQRAGHVQFELLFTSTALWRAMGERGRVLHSLIDPPQFPLVLPVPRPFTLGRFSRDYAFKHHHEDVLIYQDVLARSGAVSLMGADSLQPKPKASAALTLLPAGSESAPQFLARLDCFFYRTDWFETFGRVVHEAMCSGLAVLCHRTVGGAEHIQHGVNGLVFETTGEALDGLDQLRRDPAWRLKIGTAARETMLSLHGKNLRTATIAMLLGSSGCEGAAHGA